MGFYTPDQLIQDTKRHSITILPVDALYSAWDHTLENSGIRLGMRLIKGLSQSSAERIVAYRTQHPNSSAAHFMSHIQLPQDQMDALANADALRSITGHRYQTHWQLSGHQPALALSGESHTCEPSIALNTPTEWATVHADYRSMGLTLNIHPIALLKQRQPHLNRCATAQSLSTIPAQKLVRIAGLITGRQRPGTAKGTTFLTLEDETGNVNVIVWPKVAERFLTIMLQAKAMMILGTIERSHSVVHVVAGKLMDLSGEVATLSLASRDFH